MSPLSFVGVPDARSALLAAAFALPWLVLLAWGRLGRPWLWVAVGAAAILFPLTIAWVQVPLQRGIGAVWGHLLSLEAIRRYLLLVGVPTILVASLVQEGAKLLVAAVTLRALAGGHEPRAGLAAGAAAGAGYGGFEAFWVFNQILASGWSWATVQLLGAGALLGFVERFVTVPFHIGSAALAGYGYATGRPWRFLLLAVGLHSLMNYGVVLMQAGLIDVLVAEAWVAVVAVATVALALGLRWRARRVAA